MSRVPHIIRLRAPWQWTEVGPREDGGVHFQAARRFNCPTGLGPATKVLLVLDGISGICRVQLNDVPLQIHHRSELVSCCEIQAHLRPSNQLLLNIQVDEQTCSLEQIQQLLAAGHVWLELGP